MSEKSLYPKCGEDFCSYWHIQGKEDADNYSRGVQNSNYSLLLVTTQFQNGKRKLVRVENKPVLCTSLYQCLSFFYPEESLK